MSREKTFLAVIPARSGSKRLPKKNLTCLAGKPLIAWSIESALKSRHIHDISVSSDDPEILEIARSYGVNPVKRPAHLASETATTFEAVKHTIQNTDLHDYTILLQPTSPLRNEIHIDEAVEMLLGKKADAVISVSKVDHPPEWSNLLPEDGNMEGFLAKSIHNKRSQELSDYYRINGAIYICKTDMLLKEESFFLKKNIFSYPMAKHYSVDIDDIIDLKLAELLMSGSG